MYSKIYLFGISISSYGFVVLIGIIFTYLIGLIFTFHKKLNTVVYNLIALSGGVFAIVGAKIWYILTNLDKAISFYPINKFIKSGYSLYGGLFLGTFSIYILLKIINVNISSYINCYVFLIPLLHSIWKIGCFMGGCCKGLPCNEKLFPYPLSNLIAENGNLFPVQLLESIILIILTVIFYAFSINGQLHLVPKYYICYSLIRFLLEFIRDGKKIFIFTIAQWVSILIFIIFTTFLIKTNFKRRF